MELRALEKMIATLESRKTLPEKAHTPTVAGGTTWGAVGGECSKPKPKGLCGRVYITFLRSVTLLSYTPHTLVLG